MKKIIPLVLLLTVYMAPAQTLQRSDNSNDRRADSTKYSKDIKAIVDSYDKAALSALYAQFSERQLLEKQDAVAYAMVRNIPIKKYNPDGTFDELMKIAEDGSPIYYTLHNVNAAISTRADYLNSGGGLGLTVDGDGMLAGVWDGGPTRPTHQEFDGPGGSNRVSINDGVTTLDGNSFHAQHVTGTIVASGVNAAAKGMAWQADCITHEWNNDVTEVTTEAGNGLLLSNHSYGYIATGIPDSWFGQYGSDAQAWDNIMYNAPYYLQIKSAGNDGNNNTANASPLDGQSAYDKLNGDACAKNNLVIGNGQDASIDGSGNLISMIRNSGSSEGPTDDYRIKPDIMGNGTSLTSTYETSDTAYGTISGTSMSAPNVTGTLLLLQEHYNNLNGSFMKAATLKGLALHTADDVAAAGPDAETGWGLLNAKVAAETISASPTSALISELNLSNGATYQVTIQSDGVNPLIASISWTDPAHAPISGTNNNTPALVNDLDLTLNNGTAYNPWRLTGVTTNGTGDNNVDPFERVDISGASGQYTLTVSHDGSLTNGSQDFTLIVTGGTIAATSPEISYGTTTAITTEGTDCSFTDVSVPLNIAMAPSQNADVTFAVNGGTAGDGLDYELVTPSVTFLQGQTTSQNLIVRVYHDGVVEGPETAIIDFTVNANGGDAVANPAADSLTLTINDDDAVPSTSTDITLFTEDFEDWTEWQIGDRDGDGNIWVDLSFSSGGFTGFAGQFVGSETNLSILGGTGKANADNYLISPQISIPSNTTNTAFTFSVGGFNTAEHYLLKWTTDISSYATIDAGITLEERNSINGDGEVRTINRTDIAGQSGYFVVRHYNSFANNGLLLFDALSVVATTETPVQTAVNAGTSDQTDIPGGGTTYTYDSSTGYVMLSIDNTGGDDYDCVTTHVSRAGTSGQGYNGSTAPDLVTDKTFNISPANSPSPGNVSVTFYFTEAEIAGWETAAAPWTRNDLVAARDTGSSVETTSLSIGSFGAHVTLTGSFTGLDGTYYFGPLSAFVACTGVTKTWNGSNWSPAGAPGSTDLAVINGNYTTATDGDLNVCTLTINSGNTLTVSANGYINVESDITVSSGATLEVEHQGSVVQVDNDAVATNSGTINVHLTTPPLKERDFMLMGSPMTAETRNDVFGSAYNVQEHT
ncbi:S8 family serine peptidase, partial [Aureitalea sp. L0-47]|uniref:S8 family serine peptidase n=1 Tax=Aureitalea sp. L0-47 TaxID=2816962 RepID=UPI002238AF89